MKPQISVVIPTYNRGALIEPTVQSVFEQDIAPEEVEILIIDDGSTDETWAVLQRLYAGNERVRLFHLENGGVARARNFGLQAARGEFIAYLDHDDLWLPQKLRLQAEMLKRSQRIGVALCLWHDRSEQGEIIPGHQILLANPKWKLPDGLVFDRLLRNNYIVSMTIPMVKTALMRRIGGFDVSMVPCDDWDLWIRLSKLCRFGVVRQVGAIYQRHPAQQSANEAQMLQSTQRLLHEHLLRKPLLIFLHPRAFWIAWLRTYFALTRKHYYNAARDCIAAGDWKGVLPIVIGCLKQAPLILLTPQWLYILVRLARRDSSPF